jgi:tetratricopeptide (TPR) repeat protein
VNQVDITNLILRANALVKTNWIHAAHILGTALEEHPDNLQILLNLGEIYLERQLFDKALSYYQKAIAIKPDDPHLLYIIGNCYFSAGEYRIANTYYSRVSHPTPEVLYNKALSLAFLGSHKESIDVIQELMKILSDNPFIHFLLIEQHVRIQNYEQAHHIIKQAEKKFGKHKQLLILSAVVSSKRGIWLKAYHCFSEYETLTPITGADHLIAYAQAATMIGLNDKAITLLNRAIKINPYISSVYEELVRLQLYLGDIMGARESINKAKRHIVRFNPTLKLLQDRVRNEDLNN